MGIEVRGVPRSGLAADAPQAFRSDALDGQADRCRLAALVERRARWTRRRRRSLDRRVDVLRTWALSRRQDKG